MLYVYGTMKAPQEQNTWNVIGLWKKVTILKNDAHCQAKKAGFPHYMYVQTTNSIYCHHIPWPDNTCNGEQGREEHKNHLLTSCGQVLCYQTTMSFWLQNCCHQVSEGVGRSCSICNPYLSIFHDMWRAKFTNPYIPIQMVPHLKPCQLLTSVWPIVRRNCLHTDISPQRKKLRPALMIRDTVKDDPSCNRKVLREQQHR